MGHKTSCMFEGVPYRLSRGDRRADGERGLATTERGPSSGSEGRLIGSRGYFIGTPCCGT